MGNFLTRDNVEFLAKLADLPLEPNRAEKILPVFTEWVIAANKLSEKMSQTKYQSILPITIFHHREFNGGEE